MTRPSPGRGPRRAAGWVVASLLGLLAAAALPSAAQAAISFTTTELAGESSDRPTSLQWGPDNRLYVAQQNGVIKAYAVKRTGANDYDVVGTETITHISSMANHNDDGKLAAVSGRLVTGLLVAGTPQVPVIYVTSSDPRIGAGTSGADLNLDTNSGIVSKLTRSGAGWVKQDVVRGLPRSEENHTANGMELVGSTLYVAQGGHTNNGAPSNNFALLPEYALSAAILSVDLAAIGGGTYDIPTLKGTATPFGGADGLNQAKLLASGPVKVFAPGFRNPYDLVYTQLGKLYTVDNGGNAGWGDVPQGEGPGGTCTNAVNEPGTTNADTLHLITGPGYYGGHPNPTRGNKANTFGGQSPVATANPVECDFRSGAEEGALTSFSASTNGVTEYTASNFGGALKGDLITASFDNKLYRLDLNATGGGAGKTVLASSAGSVPLDVTALPDGSPFPGTVWVAAIGNGGIYVLEPGDFGGGGGSSCQGTDDPSLDEDGDKFDNADEIDNGTNACSASDVPPDADHDFTSDLNDANDDNDALADLSDPFALDPQNGLGTALPVNFQWENEGQALGGLLGLGFTGLMANGTTNYLAQFDPTKMTAGGAGGLVTVDDVSNGDAYQGNNNQEYGFQFGVAVRPGGGPFTVRARVAAPFNGLTPEQYQSMGVFIGTGDQDNYVKLVTGANGGTMVQALAEKAGVAKSTKQALALPGPEFVDLYLAVNPQAGTVTPSFVVRQGGVTGARTAVGAPISVPTEWFTAGTGLAVGIISTSFGAAPPFPATWDFIQVYRGDTPPADAPATPPVQPRPPLQPEPPRSTDRQRPVIEKVTLSSRRFRSARRGKALATAVGTWLGVRLSERAQLQLAVERRRVRSCNSRSGRCVRYVRLRGGAAIQLAAGDNRVRFRGRLRKRALPPGTYRLVLVAQDDAGNRSRTRRIGFTIVR